MIVASNYRLGVEPRIQEPGFFDWEVFQGGISVLKSPKSYNSQINAEIAGREALGRLRSKEIQWREG
jgi:hypothetical protein